MKYALLYGFLSGLVIILTMITGIVFSGRESFFSSEWFGYLVMLVALTFIFVGVKRYRDIERGGVIKFGIAFAMGLAIAAAAGVSGAALAAEMAKLESMRTNYANPLLRIPMTFMEIFPVGFLVSLVSALLLRNPRVLPATR